ncbi:hypothetical protein V502_05852 [Pseudogymnoascus sp. VKM F-4520 (FW-2644)]|nr:hypothetical protein V502_05852 [Pseudogymnoascus sp. VKM F-4520 (FW-2644)]
MHLKAIFLGITAAMAASAAAAPPVLQGCKAVNGGSFGPAHFNCRQINCQSDEFFLGYTKGCNIEHS